MSLDSFSFLDRFGETLPLPVLLLLFVRYQIFRYLIDFDENDLLSGAGFEMHYPLIFGQYNCSKDGWKNVINRAVFLLRLTKILKSRMIIFFMHVFSEN